MKPASFNSLPPNIKKNIVSQLPPKIPKDDSFRLPNWKDGTRPLSPWDYSEENPVTQRNMAIKQRLQSNPMAGPKSQLPEQDVAEASGTVDINSIASQLRFLPTTKQAKRYRFVANGQPGQMPAMSYTVSQQEQPVITVTADGKETQNVAGVNDIIMSGPSRENYVVKAAKFPKLYQGQVGQTVIPEQSPRQVAQYRGRDTVTFTAPWGENMVLKPGDYLVRDGDQGYYRIAQAEYGQTYNPPGR